MASILKVDTIQDQAGNNIINENANVITIGASGDTITSVGTFTSFTSTGIDDNATSTAITIDSSENVGIKSTTPSSDAWSGANSLVIKDTSGDNGITIISSSTTNNGNIAFADSSGGSFSDIGGLITYLHNGDSMRFMTANAERMRLNSTGLGIGTSSPTENLEIAGTGTQTLKIDRTDASTAGAITINSANDSNYIYNLTSKNLIFGTNNNSRMTIDGSGNVGIGTSSPSAKLHVADNIKGDGNFSLGTLPSGASSSSYRQAQIANGFIADSGGTNSSFQLLQNAYVGSGNNNYAVVGSGTSHSNRIMMTSGVISFSRAYPVTADSQISYNESMRIDSSGLVRIGNTSSTGHGNTYNLIVGNESSGGDAGVLVVTPNNENGYFGFGDSGGAPGSINYNHGSNFMRFYVSSAERMRIDSSGNVLVGTTNALSASNTTDSGCMLTNSHGWITSNGASALRLQRLTSDGLLQTFYSSGTLAGALSIKGGDLAIHSQAGGHCGLRFTDEPAMLPTDYGGDISNGSMDIGRSSNKFQDIFATNGTIQTSDQNEKQSIQSLTTAEMNVAKRLSPLIKTFKWNSAVEEKGDSARTHTGIIAQDVQQAFTDEGLDASNYALFCSDTWWEKEISVEATEEQEAHTYIDYKQEVTNGYTEKTRLGVRYPQLLSFIQAYNDQRFTELEARITTLETNNP